MFSGFGSQKLTSLRSALEDKFTLHCTLPRFNKSPESKLPNTTSIPISVSIRKLSEDSTQSVRSGEIHLRDQNFQPAALGRDATKQFQNSSEIITPKSNLVQMSTFRGKTPPTITNSSCAINSLNCSLSTLNNSPSGNNGDSITDSGISCNISEQHSPSRMFSSVPESSRFPELTIVQKSPTDLRNDDASTFDLLDDDDILELIIAEAETKAVNFRRRSALRQSLPVTRTESNRETGLRSFHNPSYVSYFFQN